MQNREFLLAARVGLLLEPEVDFLLQKSIHVAVPQKSCGSTPRPGDQPFKVSKQETLD